MKTPLIFPVCFLLSSVAFAEISLDLRAELEQIENANRSVESPVDDTRVSYGGSFAITEEGSNSSVDLSYDLSRDEYLDKTFDTRTQTRGSGSLWFFNSSRTLNAFLENRISETAIDVFAPDAGDNLNKVSTTSTGVQGRARLSARDTLSLTAAKFWVNSENELSDNNSDKLELAWERRLSTRTAFGLKASHTATMPDSPTVEDFAIQRWSVNASRVLPSGNVSIELGSAYSDAEHYNGQDVGQLDEYRLDLSVGETRANLTLNGGRELVSTGMEQASDGGFTQPGQEAFELNLRDFYNARFRYSFIPERLDFSLFGDLVDEDNQIAPGYTYIKSAGASLGITLASGVLSLGADHIDREEGDDAGIFRDQTELRYSLSYSNTIGKNIGWRCGFERSNFGEDPVAGEDIVSKSVLCGIDVAVF